MIEKEFACSQCPVDGLGRFKDEAQFEKSLEKQGWKKIGGEWVCGFCNGLGAGNLDPE